MDERFAPGGTFAAAVVAAAEGRYHEALTELEQLARVFADGEHEVAREQVVRTAAFVESQALALALRAQEVRRRLSL